ncbi:prolipoprotein diacylglyceryl transferase [Acidithrix ferrooxidans]|uniref:Prolipoprotein diacylglyceryl transferase n=1 Tax=Acidithrix ferrooxidans TaxID=1280514 RepID=A0A0D8HID5_9ACTN|nr:prolipoprotein diacylglyceryl transferase family protein [Acidithrix ferrooxidans]KJF17693.1 prolipoprotein diacylglyceryl transferase [Acidithrix ferrooxidans]
MKPIPIVFNIGPVQVHTYGIGLAIAFYVAYRYFEKRLKDSGMPYNWVGKSFLWIIAAAVVGARIVHVIANISYYLKFPAQIPLIWHGGLSSFGGLAGAIPVGIYLKRKYAPDLRIADTFDKLVPALILAWSIGRILGPQLMFQGGGRPTNAWYGLQYAGQVGYRIPVPIFQATEDFIIFLILLKIEKWMTTKAPPYRSGSLAIAGLFLWSIPRFWDEYFWLAVPRLWDAVEVFSIILIISSACAFLILNSPERRNSQNTQVYDGEGEDSANTGMTNANDNEHILVDGLQPDENKPS